VVVLDVECFGRVETVGLSDGELARGCRWVACCAGVECSWWAAGWGWGEKVRANVEQVDAVKLGVVDDGDAAIDVCGDDGVGVGTGGIVLDTKAFGFHVALCEEGVFESGTPEGHGHGGWKRWDDPDVRGCGRAVLRAEVDGFGESVDVGEVMEVLYVAHAGPVVPHL
jgi:hypothetical protein